MPKNAESALTKHTMRVFGAGAVHTRNPPRVVGNWTVRECEKRLLRIAVALHDELKLLVPGASCSDDNLGLRSERVPDFRPHNLWRLAQRPRMTFAQNGNVRVIVEIREFFPPPDTHLVARVKHDA